MFGKNKTDQGAKRTLKQCVHALEENIITISGPALAISGVIAGIDVLTSNIIRENFPMVGNVLGVVWAFCLMISLDFQVLTLGVKASRIYRDTSKKEGQKFGEMLLCIIFACGISYVSVQMGTIFAQSLGMGPNFTIDMAETKLGINSAWLLYERSALVMLLIFMSGWLRDAEEKADENATQSVSTPLQGQSSELTEALRQIAEMNAQTLASMQAMQQQQMQVTIEQATRVTVEAVKQSLEALPFNQPLQIAAPNSAESATQADVPPFEREYGPEIGALYLKNPAITPEEVKAQIRCSLPTAKTHLARAAEHVDKLQVTMEWLSKQPQMTDEELADHLGLKRPASARFWRLKAMEMVRENA